MITSCKATVSIEVNFRLIKVLQIHVSCYFVCTMQMIQGCLAATSGMVIQGLL